MGLENLFKEEIKNIEEKSVAKIERTKREDVVREFEKYYNKLKEKYYFGAYFIHGADEYFNEVKSFAKSYFLSNELINDLLKNLEKSKELGVFISAIIQASYENGCNEFNFGEIRCDYFGAFLKGKGGEKIRINIENLDGRYCFYKSENCYVTGKFDGDMFMEMSKDNIVEIYGGNVEWSLFGGGKNQIKVFDSKLYSRYTPYRFNKVEFHFDDEFYRKLKEKYSIVKKLENGETLEDMIEKLEKSRFGIFGTKKWKELKEIYELIHEFREEKKFCELNYWGKFDRLKNLKTEKKIALGFALSNLLLGIGSAIVGTPVCLISGGLASFCAIDAKRNIKEEREFRREFLKNLKERAREVDKKFKIYYEKNKIKDNKKLIITI